MGVIYANKQLANFTSRNGPTGLGQDLVRPSSINCPILRRYRFMKTPENSPLANPHQTVNLNSWWRVTASLRERLLILPPIDSDTRDKINIVRASAAGMPMSTETTED
jgi:hypothetical protein